MLGLSLFNFFCSCGLSQALLLCFKLQESRIAVVSSTAAATLRQLVMFVVDKMIVEDHDGTTNSQESTEISLPDGTTKALGPSARDAFSVFEDLCLLANSEKPHFLKLDYLHKTFALELIESVLTNYHDLFRKVPVTPTSSSRLFSADVFLAFRTFVAPAAPSLSLTSEGFV
jgi:Guanine nucleotide exchange factor in Golgi transport N-terminal/Dimerisation and cyclophilin-binding domain of Mon2